MIYTITSTLPKVHGGRTKSLLKRIDFIQDKLKIKQTILTTNYDPNYRNVYQSFEERKILKSSIPIINIYEWLSDFNVYNIFVCQNKLDNFSSSMKLINTSNGVL